MNETLASTTDPGARPARKAAGQARILAYAGHVLMENRSGAGPAGPEALTRLKAHNAAVRRVRCTSACSPSRIMPAAWVDALGGAELGAEAAPHRTALGALPCSQ